MWRRLTGVAVGFVGQLIGLEMFTSGVGKIRPLYGMRLSRKVKTSCDMMFICL